MTKRHPHFIEDEQFGILAVLRKLGRGCAESNESYPFDTLVS